MQAFDARPAFASGDALRFHDLPGGPVADGGIEDLALADEVVEGAYGFLDRCGGIVVVEEVNINAIGFEAPEAVFDGDLEVPAAKRRRR